MKDYFQDPEYLELRKRIQKAMTAQEIFQIRNDAWWKRYIDICDDCKWILVTQYGYEIKDGKLHHPEPADL